MSISYSLRTRRDSNSRPSAWQADILTNWTTNPKITGFSFPFEHHNKYIPTSVVTFSSLGNYSRLIVTLPSPLWYLESRQLFGIYRHWGHTTVVTCVTKIRNNNDIQKYFKSFLLRGQESNLRHSAYETGGKPFSPQYGVIDEVRTRFILAPQASALPYEHRSQSQVLESNQCRRFCRPLPNHSANLTFCSLMFSVHGPWTNKICEHWGL